MNAGINVFDFCNLIVVEFPGSHIDLRAEPFIREGRDAETVPTGQILSIPEGHVPEGKQMAP
jgi:hypothetical protein